MKETTGQGQERVRKQCGVNGYSIPEGPWSSPLYQAYKWGNSRGRRRRFSQKHSSNRALYNRLGSRREGEKKTGYAHEQTRPDVHAARTAWRRRQPTPAPSRSIFINEPGLNPKLARLRGRCRWEERLGARLPPGHWSTTTFIAGLRRDGLTAPMLLPGALDGTAFRAYVEQGFGSTLRPGDGMILDNLAVNKGQAVRRAIEAMGATWLLLPPYSPEYNPIEPGFAKLKAGLRAAARTRATLWHAVGAALLAFMPEECTRYFAPAGYDLI